MSDARRATAITLVVWLTLLTSGCGAQVLTGTALRDPRSDPRAVTASMLDPGDFPTKPHSPLGTAGSTAAGALIEARRMAEVVLVPFEIDPAIYLPADDASGPFTDLAGLGMFFYNPFSVTVGEHNFVAGFTSAASREFGSDVDITTLKNTVLRFATDADAAAAAAEMAAHSTHDPIALESGDTAAAQWAVPLADHPGTAVFATGRDPVYDVVAFTAQGPYVLLQRARARAEEVAVSLVVAALDKQRPALESFTPTPVDQLAALPADPTGLEARTLPVAGERTDSAGTYGPRGALNFTPNAARAQAQFNAAGLQAAVMLGVNVFQLRDVAAAARFVDDFATSAVAHRFSRAAPVPGLPGALCFLAPKDEASFTEESYRCALAVDRNAIDLTSPSETEAQQMLTAQYLLLTAA